MEEACLPVPGYQGEIKRSVTVKVKAQDYQGKEFHLKGEGLLAQALEHETDHLNGTLYIDHVESPEKLFKLFKFVKEGEGKISPPRGLMSKKCKEGILPFKIVATDEPLIARAIKLPGVIDRELPPPGSGRGYKPSQFVMPLLLMLHGREKKLNELREIKGEWYRTFTIQTVRWQLYQVAGAVTRHANQVWLKLKAPLEKNRAIQLPLKTKFFRGN